MPPTLSTVTGTLRRDPSPDRLERYAEQGRCVRDRFSSCCIGGMLLRKLLGFIEDEEAEVLDISESHVTLRMGRPWLQRLRGVDRRCPIEVRIQFAEPGEDLGDWQKSQARRSEVQVRVRPLSQWYPTGDFHRRADSILQLLRLHFLAD